MGFPESQNGRDVGMVYGVSPPTQIGILDMGFREWDV